MKLAMSLKLAAAIAVAALMSLIATQGFNPATARADQPASTAPSSQPAKWIKLFADEDWYKNQAGKEQVFAGKLEAIKVNPDQATTLMRTSYYRMGGRNIYTGGKKVKELDGLVGKNVEIRGKTYDINLEGQAVSEIWPAEIRQAEAGASTAPAPPPPSSGKD
ncbi:MAG: hypothetical protein HZA50_15725 [Planctomycetes bacterium]|nr:hypothetical protein [Planctomycetota bacterium]